MGACKMRREVDTNRIEHVNIIYIYRYIYIYIYHYLSKVCSARFADYCGPN